MVDSDPTLLLMTCGVGSKVVNDNYDDDDDDDEHDDDEMDHDDDDDSDHDDNSEYDDCYEFGFYSSREIIRQPLHAQLQLQKSSTNNNKHPKSSNSSNDELWDRAIRQLISDLWGSDSPAPDCMAPSSISRHHVRQLESWDCGIACIQIILRWLRWHYPEENDSNDNNSTSSSSICYSSTLSEEEHIERQVLLEKAATCSIWTSDLVLLLEDLVQTHHPFRYLYCSNTFQVNESFQDMSYYHSAFDHDRIRVQHRFDTIHTQGLPILECHGLSMRRLQHLLMRYAGNIMAIVLIDNALLKQASSSPCTTPLLSSSTSYPSIMTEKSMHEYVGHYLVLAGISYDPDHVALAHAHDVAISSCNDTNGNDSAESEDYCWVVHNPGIDEPVSFLSPDRLERAWRAAGTDEDLVLIARGGKQASGLHLP
jgi:hypothetical protein